MAEGKINILVIDDELSVLESFKMILKIKDYNVSTFADGPSALNSLKPGQYDIAFIDLKLPGMDGIEILKRIKELDPEIEVVIVTAYATESSHANAITLGALEYLRKPFLMEEIYELVDRGLKRRRSRGIKKEGEENPPPLSNIH
ncbi:MAG: response regulator [Candidatus Pacearchaeota archaeon]